MEILLGILTVLVLANTVLTIAVAAILSKLVKSDQEDDFYGSMEKISSEKLIDLPIVGPPTYDLAVLSGKAEPYTDGLGRRLTPTKNWDGISQQE